MRDPAAREELEAEGVAMKAAAAAGVPVPAVGQLVEYDGRPGLLMERLGQVDLLTGLGRRPWRLPEVAKTLGELHARINSLAAPEGLPPVHDVVRDFFGDRDDETARRALAALAELPRADRLLHGDMHPGNLLTRDDGGVVAIDWPRAARGDPSADVAWSVMLIRIARLHPTAPRLLKTIHPLGRSLMERIYLRAYAASAPLDMELLERWLPVLAAARLVFEIEGEREALLALLG